MMNKFQFIFLIICLFKTTLAGDDLDSDEKRKFSVTVNPGCNIEQCKKPLNSSDLSIVHVRSSKYKKENVKSGLDLHFILSTYNGTPAFFVVSTLNNSDLKINWNELFKNEPNSIKFAVNDKEIQHNNTIGVLVNKLFMWLDTNEAEADYVPGKCVQKEIPHSALKWNNVTILENADNRLHVEFELKEKLFNGTITIRLMVPSTLQKYPELPRLLFTPKSVHVQLKFKGFEEMFPLNDTNRLGLQLTVISQGEKKNITSMDTYDDEDSPGLFTTYKYPFGKKVADSSFISFKPNAYVTPDRLIAKTIDSKQTSLVEARDTQAVFQQNNAFYGFYNNSSLNAYQMYITFGSKGQEFYSKTNYTEFNFVLGLGDLPRTEKSFFIKMVIIIGSGLSLLVLLIFPITIYLMAKKMKKRRESGLLYNQDSIY